VPVCCKYALHLTQIFEAQKQGQQGRIAKPAIQQETNIRIKPLCLNKISRAEFPKQQSSKKQHEIETNLFEQD
jgi:hypothetical protein